MSYNGINNTQMITMTRINTMSTMQKCHYNSNNITMDINNSSNCYNNVKYNRNDLIINKDP